MPNTQLHSRVIPDDATLRTKSQIQRQLQAAGVLNGGPSTVEDLGLGPNERVLEGQYRGQYADVMAQELEELFDADDISTVPYFAPAAGTTISERGYYLLSNIDSSPLHPQAREFAQEFTGRLRKVGTRKTHWRAVKTVPTQIENDFGNAQTAEIGIPAAATKVKWLNEETGAYEDAALVATRAAQHGNVDVYDAKAASFATPTLIHDVAFDQEYLTDALVYDDRGNASKTDANGNVQWAHVFDPGHEFEGKIVLDNGLLRVTFDEANNSLTVEEWDDANSTWSAIALGSSTAADEWQVWDVDITRIGLSRVTAQVIWEDTGDGSLYHLNCQVVRGVTRIQWYVPGGESPPTPSGLQTKLDPTADDQDFSPGSEQALVRRENVRK